MRIAVVIPTFQRPEMLCACVQSLLAGVRRPDEIVIAGREGDEGTRAAVQRLQMEAGELIRSTWVREPGHIPPVHAGARAAGTELVAFVDDDVTVTPEWLREISKHFDDPRIGVAGGRVVVPGLPTPVMKGRPGHITWYGKHWGNIGSLEAAAPLDVMSLMEGNWAWRRELFLSLDFDPVLNFDDASMYGLDLCFQARRRGYRVVYDSRALVYHHAAPRVAELDRAAAQRRASYSRNYTYILLRNVPAWQRLTFLLWWFLLGERGSPGLGAGLSEILRNGRRGREEFGAAWAGKLEGLRLSLRSGRPALERGSAVKPSERRRTGFPTGLVRVWQKAPLSWRQAVVSSSLAPIARSFLNRIWPGQPRMFELSAPLAGHRMWLHWQSQKAFAFGTFEPEVTRQIEGLVQPGWRVLDVGAHIGYHTLFLAKCAGSQGQVFAFEPWPENFRVLTENMALNDCTNIRLIPKAVMERTGKVRLRQSDTARLSAMVSVASDGELEVEAVALDDFVRENLSGETVNFVKMDIEGAETAALQGMRGVLRSHSPVMLIELHGFEQHREKHPAIRVLQEEGYSIQYLEPGGAQVHVVARPGERA